MNITTRFNHEIKNSNLPVTIDLSYRERPLLIAFGGIAGSMGMPPFEFYNMARDQDVNKIYLRDLGQSWYHSGLMGISRNIDETASFLRGKIDESGAQKVVVFGNSMGGYAAILFGTLINADVVHAFSPQTIISDARHLRNKEQIKYVHAKYAHQYFDLRKVMKSADNLGEFNLYYDCEDELDRRHCKHLKKLQNIVLHPYSGGGHDLIKLLKDSGELREIVVSSINNTPDRATDADARKHRPFTRRNLLEDR